MGVNAMDGNPESTSELANADGAAFGTRSGNEAFTMLVAPSTENAFNTLGERLPLRACFRIEDIRFEFDSSFIKPEATQEMPLLADLIEKYTLTVEGRTLKPPLSIFGHADPVGRDDYNKKLSGRRSAAVYAMLVRDADMWEELYTKPAGGDNWGAKSIQTILAALGYETGPIDGVMGEQTKEAIRSFQGDRGLAVDGVAGPATRKELFRAYMDLLCGPGLALEKEENFLARNRDAKGKGDYQGCGEFNPILMFSREEHDRYERDQDKTERDAENAPNRRVIILLFPAGRKVDPALWPCSRATEGPSGCQKRFFADAAQRREFTSRRRAFAETRDTFACRFYYLLASDSPCEAGALLSFDCFIYLKLFDDSFENTLAHQSYTVRGERRGLTIEGTTDAAGVLRHERIPDDHYMLTCGGKEETVEAFYMNEKEQHSGKPWYMRIRGFVSEEQAG